MNILGGAGNPRTEHHSTPSPTRRSDRDLALLCSGLCRHLWLGAKSLSLRAAYTTAFREAGAQVPVEAGTLVVEPAAGDPAGQAGLLGGRTAGEQGCR